MLGIGFIRCDTTYQGDVDIKNNAEDIDENLYCDGKFVVNFLYHDNNLIKKNGCGGDFLMF